MAALLQTGSSYCSPVPYSPQWYAHPNSYYYYLASTAERAQLFFSPWGVHLNLFGGYLTSDTRRAAHTYTVSDLAHGRKVDTLSLREKPKRVQRVLYSFSYPDFFTHPVRPKQPSLFHFTDLGFAVEITELSLWVLCGHYECWRAELSSSVPRLTDSFMIWA